MIDTQIFTIGGTVQASGGAYVARPVDEEFLRLCQTGEYCYVLTARQMGKSSLMVRTADELAKDGTRSVILDLTRLGATLEADQWYLGLIDEIVEQLELTVDYVAWWHTHAHLGPTQRLDQFMRRVVLETIKEPIVIFIDEIDSTLKLPFTDDFFAAIRAAYNARANDPEYRRLTVALLGVARPADLIKDRTRTPYNIGVKVDLQDFTFDELDVFQSALEKAYPGQGAEALRWILDWSGGQPYLTQKLCAALVERPDGRLVAQDIEKLVERLFLGEEAKKESNLQTIQDRLQTSPYLRGIMRVYRQVLQGRSVPDDERSIEQSELKLSGLVRSSSRGTLELRNRIYARVFDAAWVKANTPVNWTQRAAIGASVLAVVALMLAIRSTATVSSLRQPVIEFFESSQTEVGIGSAVQIRWSAVNADTVELTAPVQNSLQPQGVMTFTINQSTNFTLRATNANGSVEQTVAVALRGTLPVITFFRVDQTELVAGQADKVTLTWSVAGADSVTIDGVTVPATSNDPKGSPPSLVVDPPAADKTYVLVATNQAGPAKASVIVRVTLPSCTLSAAADLREGPSAQDTLIRSLANGDMVTPTLRTDVGDWVRVANGWVPAASLTCNINLLKLAAFTPLKTVAQDCSYGGELKSIAALDEKTVKFTLCSPDAALPAKVALPSFGIQSAKHLEQTGGKPLDQPLGTGPYILKEWTRGDHLTLTVNPNYWGVDKPKNPSVTFLWNQDAAARLTQLKAAKADGIDSPAPSDYPAITADRALKLITREPLNIGYLGINNARPPLDNELVRQAIAQAIDRQALVTQFYDPGTVVADFFAPCIVPGGCEGEPWYSYNPDAARQLLAKAGFPNGFKARLSFRDVVRPYLPNAPAVAKAIQAQLKQVGIDATLDQQESATFLDNASKGDLDLFLLGWPADFPDQIDFLGQHFGRSASDQFGKKYDDLTAVLAQAASLADRPQRNQWYAQANNLVKQHVPVVPLVHRGTAVAFTATVEGAYADPLGTEQLGLMRVPGRDTFVWMQVSEPASLYCADESDYDSLRACQQIFESLLSYKTGTAEIMPGLADLPKANVDSTEWTFVLRDGVKFSDGTPVTANDVVKTFVVQWDGSDPLHIGNSGFFDYWSVLFGGFLNPPKK